MEDTSVLIYDAIKQVKVLSRHRDAIRLGLGTYPYVLLPSVAGEYACSAGWGPALIKAIGL